jgi:hypothetical protein
MQRILIAAMSLFAIFLAEVQLASASSLGNLTCSVGGEAESEATAVRARKIFCVFRLSDSDTDEIYVGTAFFSDLSAFPASRRSLSWIVKGPREVMQAPGGLEQTYMALGGEAKDDTPLVGKQMAAIALHPLAVHDGLETVVPAESSRAAVIDLKLKSTTA